MKDKDTLMFRYSLVGQLVSPSARLTELCTSWTVQPTSSSN